MNQYYAMTTYRMNFSQLLERDYACWMAVLLFNQRHRCTEKLHVMGMSDNR